MPEAAHQTHQVAHSLGMAGLIAGAVVGGILAVGITVATGGAGAVVIASAVATGVSAGGGLGKMIGSHFSGMPSGPIMLNCATNVLIEGLPAATVGSLTMCTGGMIGPPHPSSPIVQGSRTVFINGKPAARKGDKLACSASVNEGCATVIIGGETITVGPLNPEIPEWVDWGLMGLGMLGGYGLLRAGGMGVMAAAARIGGATAGGMGGSLLGGWGAQQLGYQPGSWGHDLASLGGGLLGGWAGYKVGGRAVPVRNTRLATDVETQQIAKIREDNIISKKKNIAYAEGTIGDEPYYREGHSGQNSKPGTANAKDFPDQTLDTKPTKQDIERGSTTPDQRAYDSEVKILEEVLDQTNNNPDVNGTIKIVSERPICDSCMDAIRQFEKLRPNIKIERVETTPPKK
ncbi:PAAR domain-containing protein [Fibrella sp. WM1]|uniref:PAAR domain-containing protein n=1 Tax=Fibrella musci TaxID=3242485 RepID=UPI00352131FE